MRPRAHRRAVAALATEWTKLWSLRSMVFLPLVGAVACVLRLGRKVKDPKRIVKALDAGQRKDGGFGRADASGSDLETSYRVMRTYHMLRAKPARADDFRAFVAKCRNKDGGYGVAPGQPSAAGSTYFASIILHWLGGK